MFPARLAIVSTALLGMSLLAAGQQLNVQMLDRAHVPQSDLAHAKRELARIFARAGIAVTWSPQDLDVSAAAVTDFSARPCTSQSGPPGASLTVLLFPRVPNGVPAGTLGYSLPCARFGAQLIVYVDACERVAAQYPVSFRQVLAYAIAHEIAHVLLRSASHSNAGLMLGRWDKRAWQQAAVGAVGLQLEEAETIRHNLMATRPMPPSVQLSQTPRLQQPNGLIARGSIPTIRSAR